MGQGGIEGFQRHGIAGGRAKGFQAGRGLGQHRGFRAGGQGRGQGCLAADEP